MPRIQPLDLAVIDALRTLLGRFPDRDRKLRLLHACTRRDLGDTEALLAYHDTLLFCLAYPETAELRRLAERELKRIEAAARRIDETGPARARTKLRASGLAWSEITISFSYAIVCWLVERYSDLAEIDSFGEGGELLGELLRHALSAVEIELVEGDDATPEALIDSASAGWRGTRLAWLVAQFERMPCDSALRETLYDALQPFVTISARDSPISRTTVRGLSAPMFFHRSPLLRGVDAAAIIATPLPERQRLGRGDGVHLTDAARAMLAMLGRETDPITHADAAWTRYYDLGRGVAIALYSTRALRRTPLDSHIGYMLFKNGVPLGYGGGWPFLGTCKIGINIFAPYRGRESSFLMASVLRTYAQLFSVERFVVEPYQFGAGNREGLLSGAFWFYFRLGFRPVDPRLRYLSSQEFERMGSERGYRSPLAVLRRFTRSDLELVLVTDATAACEPAELSHATNAWIATRFRGRRDAAEAFALTTVSEALRLGDTTHWNGRERHALRVLAPVLAQIRGLSDWPPRDRRRLIAMIRTKGGDEYRYFALMAGFSRLRRALEAVARSEPAEPPAIKHKRASGI